MSRSRHPFGGVRHAEEMRRRVAIVLASLRNGLCEKVFVLLQQLEIVSDLSYEDIHHRDVESHKIGAGGELIDEALVKDLMSRSFCTKIS